MGFDALPGWRDDPVEETWPAFLVGCARLLARDNGAGGASGADGNNPNARAASAPASPWRAPCTAAPFVDAAAPSAVRAFFEANFSAYAVLARDGTASGLVTGYYEPLLLGSRTRDPRFRVPLYAAPEDLLTIDLVALYPDLAGRRLRGRVEGRRVVPYWSREDITAGRAGLAGRELVYVEDPVEAFFLEIQGSGRIQLADGTVLRLGYADQNGHPYRSLGRVLADSGELPLERTSMQNIREWGRRNPARLPEFLNSNPSYVFFREVPAPAPGTVEARIDGPIGSLGAPLLARRTVAVDTRAIPLGTPVWIATTYPSSARPLQRLVMAQDTGGAIRGAVRADFFWGFGDEAGREAGRMKQEARMWLLWPNGAGAPGRE